MRDTPCLLFVCTHNAARSQMAEALLRHHAGDRFEATSAGFDPSDVHPLARHVPAEIGVDSTGLRAKPTQEFLGRKAVRYAIIVCKQTEERCPRVFPFTTGTLYWAVDDPAVAAHTPEVQLAAFRHVRDEIDVRLRAWLRELGAAWPSTPPTRVG
jgi:arsenate reductase (thioredoxin)